MISMTTKQLIRRVLPPSVTIHLMAALNYRQGEPELKLLKSLVDPQKDSIDIGANKGIYTYFFARLCSHVFAYEPNPELAATLAKSFGSKVTVNAIALSNTTGEATLSIPLVDNFFYDQLGTLETKATTSESQEKTYQVPLQKLDDLEHSNIGFIKIDVEGHEISALKGMKSLLERDHPVVVAEGHTDEVVAFMESLGYSHQRFDKSPNTLYTF